MTSFRLPGDASYFEKARRPQLSQGDIFLAPAAVVTQAVNPAPGPLRSAALPPMAGEAVTVLAWGDPRFEPMGGIPAVAIVVTWVPVMVLSHDCEIDKDFNESVDRHRRANPELSEALATAMFADRADLDPYVLIAPLLPYDDVLIPAWRHEGIRQAARIGYIPVPPIPNYGANDYCVPLTRMCTVQRQLLDERFQVASLSESARCIVRFKLAEALASRNLSVVSNPEAAVGRTIADVRTLKSKQSSATLALILDDGSELQVDAKPDRPADDLPERLRKSKP